NGSASAPLNSNSTRSAGRSAKDYGLRKFDKSKLRRSVVEAFTLLCGSTGGPCRPRAGEIARTGHAVCATAPAKVKRAVDAAFEPAAGMTAAFVVTWRGRLIGEPYGPGIAKDTPLES